MDSSPVAIQTNDLAVGYGATEVLHGLDLTLAMGQWCVLLGPNGSGKTTLLKTLMGLLVPTRGQASVLGRDAYRERYEVRKRVGYVAEEPYLYQELNAIEHLIFAGDMFCLPPAEMKARIAELLAGLDLEDKARARVGTFSLGMKRKLAIALALMHRPPVLILDEPLNGLDPVMADLCRQLLRRMCHEQKVSILMSTHNMGMTAEMCDRLLVICKGNLLADSTPRALEERFPGRSLEAIFLEMVGATPPPVSLPPQGSSAGPSHP
jgi:ABC-type multidrug transport system ATPase subunit